MSKQYITSHQLSNRGESFVENIISGHTLAHKIDRSKDLGLDFICEWVAGQNPTQLLFGIQVKTRSNPIITPVDPLISRLNGLEQYKINFDGDGLNDDTFEYWKGFNFPVFLFLVHMNGAIVNCYYKRYTPILHDSAKPTEENYFKVYENNLFLAFHERPGNLQTGGFGRDLFFDHLRCEHSKGMLSGIDPSDLGLEGYRNGDLYEGVYNKYVPIMKATYEKYKIIFDDDSLNPETAPSAPPPDEND